MTPVDTAECLRTRQVERELLLRMIAIEPYAECWRGQLARCDAAITLLQADLTLSSSPAS